MKLLILLGLCFAEGAQADQQKVVFLTSLDTEKMKVCCLLKSYFHDYVNKLEDTFREQFAGTQYAIEIVQRADQFQLWSALHDPKAVAVFWLSHASSSDAFDRQNQLFSTHAILDWQGFDVTPVFEKIHPNLRFLGVISCFSGSILDTLPKVSQDPRHPDHPYLRVFSFNSRVEAKKGLKQAIAKAKEVLDIPEIKLGYECHSPPVPGYRVQLTRSFGLPPEVVSKRQGIVPIRPAARIMAGQKVLNVLPSVDAGSGPPEELQKQTLFIPKDSERLPDLRIDAGLNAWLLFDQDRLKTLELGKLSLDLVGRSNSEQEPWSLWRTPDGHAIGVFQNSYKISSDRMKAIDLSQYIVEESEFNCEPMPAYE